MQFPKRGRVVLKGPAYKAWTRRIFTRDGWRCRKCSSKKQLQVHHLISRSELRLDIESNGISLCADCHEDVERERVLVIGETEDTVQFRYKE